MSKVTLYIAEHNNTGKKYFGKTTRWFTVDDLQKHYHGSGFIGCNKEGGITAMKRWHFDQCKHRSIQ